MLEFAVLAILAVPPTGVLEPSRKEDLNALLEKARRVQVEDMAAWRRFRFRRTILREERDEERDVRKRERLTLDVTPTPSGFDERLSEIEGRSPTPAEVEAYRRQSRFNKQYRSFMGGKSGGDSRRRGYSLGLLLNMSSYRYAGIEPVDEAPCYRLDFSPDPTRMASGLTGKIVKTMEGSLWLSVDGLHLARVKARAVRPISVALSLGRLHELEIEMEAAPVSRDVWLPVKLVWKSCDRVLLTTRYRNNVFHYLQFEPTMSGQRETLHTH
jgi:hypothetical protein